MGREAFRFRSRKPSAGGDRRERRHPAGNL